MGSSERAMMWHLVCLILIASYHRTEASQDSPMDFSCTCRHPDNCHPNHRITENSSAVSNYCENENFIKCCSTPEDLEIPEERTQFEIDLISRVMKKIYTMLHPGSEETEAAVSESQSLREPENLKPDRDEEEKVQDTTEIPNDFGRNILKSVKDVMSFMDENKYEFPSQNSERQFKEQSFLPTEEAHAIRVKILNHLPAKITGIPVGFSIPVEKRPKSELIHHQSIAGRPRMITNDDGSKLTVDQEEADIQRLIDENTSFESRKTFPIIPDTRGHRWKVLRKRNNHRTAALPKFPKPDEEYERLSRLIGSFESQKEGNTYVLPENESQQGDFGVNEKISIPIAANAPKKVADLFRHETSLEALLALDQASVHPADGNTLNSPSKLSLPEDVDISIPYSHQESIKNVPRLIRSRPITQEKETEKLSEQEKTSIASTGNKVRNAKEINKDSTETLTPVSRFRRPPRVLPKRIDAGIHSNSDKHRNSRERVHDLFNRSAESKSRASLIIKRRERNLVGFLPNQSGAKSDTEIEEISTGDSKSGITIERKET